MARDSGYCGYILDIYDERCDRLLMYDFLVCPDDEKGQGTRSAKNEV